LIYNRSELVDKEKVSEQSLVLAMFEFAAFYIHFTNRAIFDRFGENGSSIIDVVIKNVDKEFKQLFKDYTENDKTNLRSLFYAVYNEAEENYSQCTSLNAEKTSLASRMAGNRNTALITYLIDRVYYAYKGLEVADNILFTEFVKRLVITTCETKELQGMVNKI
jgi:hypothetical protein